MLRVVFDTVVFVRSLINPYGVWGKLVFDYYQTYQLFVSKPVVTEIVEVLQRPELTTKFRTLKAMDISTTIVLLGQARVVEVEEIPNISRDPQDDKFLATALAANADYLVSEDKDLLILKEYRGVKIVAATTFVRILEKGKAK